MSESQVHQVAPVTEKVTGCIRLDGQAFNYSPLDVATPGRAITADVTGHGIAPTLGAGLALFEDIDFDWVHPCDEAVYVITGELQVTSATGTVVGRPGDIMFMTRGTLLHYTTHGVCTVFASMNLTPQHLEGSADA